MSITNKQLTSHKEVSVGDRIICNANYGYSYLLTEGKEYEVVSSEPSPFGMYQRDYVTVVSDNPNKKVTAHLTRFGKPIDTTEELKCQ